MTTGQAARHYRQRRWWPDQALWDRYATVAARSPQGLAVVDDRGATLTHAALRDAAERMAADLAGAGVAPGDLVLVVMPNRVEWQVVFAALLRLDAVPMTVPVTTDAATLSYLCDLAGVAALITTTRSGSVALADVVTEAAAGARRRPAVAVVDDPSAVRVRHPGEGTRATQDRRHQPIDGLAHVMTTSSTTGRPKAVMHSSNTLAALNIGFAERFGLGPDTPIFMASPLGHSVGAIHGARLSMHVGAPLVLQERWDPEHALRLVATHGCRFTCAATPFLKDLIDAPAPAGEPKLASLRRFLCGGAAVPPLLIDQAGVEFPNTSVSVLWGMTEGGVTTCTATSTPEQRRTTAGCGLPGLELRAIDTDLRHLPAGESGELAMRGPGVFIGYLGQDDVFAESITPDGFFRTGDLARVDGDGYLRLTGRLKDLIIRGGVNISPVVIEDVLAGHPQVRRVAVVGEPDERLGERLCAVVVTQGGGDLALDDLIRWSGDHGLARRYWPESLRIVDDMPTTAGGKIRKHQLRDTLFGERP